MQVKNLGICGASLLALSLTACGGSSGSSELDTVLDTLEEAANQISETPVDDDGTAGDVDEVSILNLFGNAFDATRGTVLGGQPGTGDRIPVPDAPEDLYWGMPELNFGNDVAIVRRAVLGKFSSNASALRYLSRVNRELDACLMLDDRDSDEASFDATVDRWEMRPLEAGEVLIYSQGGTTIGESEFDDFHGYDPDGISTRDVTTPVMLDVTGDEFPAMPTASFPVLEKFAGIRAKGSNNLFTGSPGSFQPVRDATIEWEPGTDPDATIEVGLNGYIYPNGEEEELNVYCTLEDDGEFTFPAEVISQYEEGDRARIETARQKINVVEANGAVLLMISTN